MLKHKHCLSIYSSTVIVALVGIVTITDATTDDMHQIEML
jgi:hypothetical protein